jgi:hypothetical protein
VPRETKRTRISQNRSGDSADVDFRPEHAVGMQVRSIAAPGASTDRPLLLTD